VASYSTMQRWTGEKVGKIFDLNGFFSFIASKISLSGRKYNLIKDCRCSSTQKSTEVLWIKYRKQMTKVTVRKISMEPKYITKKKTMKRATKNPRNMHIKVLYEKVIERYLNLCNCITNLNKNLIRQNGVFILIVHLRCGISSLCCWYNLIISRMFNQLEEELVSNLNCYWNNSNFWCGGWRDICGRMWWSLRPKCRRNEGMLHGSCISTGKKIQLFRRKNDLFLKIQLTSQNNFFSEFKTFCWQRSGWRKSEFLYILFS